jgi:Subtilisin inhibitor-like
MSFIVATLLASTSLRITVWPNGQGHAPKRTYTLTCAPVGGTLPHPAQACAQLAPLRDPFAPTPPGTACTQIYGGPHEALVVGRFRGVKVHARFSRKERLRDRPLETHPVPLPRDVAPRRLRSRVDHLRIF